MASFLKNKKYINEIKERNFHKKLFQFEKVIEKYF